MSKKMSFDFFLNVHCVECGRKTNIATTVGIPICYKCAVTRPQEIINLIEVGYYKPRNYLAEYINSLNLKESKV